MKLLQREGDAKMVGFWKLLEKWRERKCQVYTMKYINENLYKTSFFVVLLSRSLINIIYGLLSGLVGFSIRCRRKRSI